MLVDLRKDAFNILLHFLEFHRTSGGFGAQFRDVKSERRTKNSRSLARIQIPYRIFKFLDHSSGEEATEVAAIPLAVGMPFSYLGERQTAFQLSKRHVNEGPRLLFALLLINVFDNMRSFKHRRAAEVLTILPVEGRDLFGTRLTGASGHLVCRALQPEVPFDPLPQLTVIVRAAAIPDRFLLLQLPF